MSEIFHVTFTKNINAIMDHGILPFMTTNWVKGNGERYGAGEIYAFAEFEDAVRWAGKMDWHYHQEIGSGKIAVITANRGDGWEIDDADPLGQAGRKGDWLKRYEPIKPIDIRRAAPVTKFAMRKQAR